MSTVVIGGAEVAHEDGGHDEEEEDNDMMTAVMGDDTGDGSRQCRGINGQAESIMRHCSASTTHCSHCVRDSFAIFAH